MIHHLSLPALDPRRVAGVLAELTGGRPFEFPVAPGAWMVLFGDRHGSALEILPAGTIWRPGPGEVEVAAAEGPLACSAFHMFLSVPVSRERIEEVGMREGWLVRRCDRGPFQLIELWIENRFMVELVTASMLPTYLSFMEPEAYGTWLHQVQAAGDPLPAATEA